MEEVPTGPSIYLAGPVPRDPSQPSWHSHACELFAARGFDGCLILPKPRGPTWPSDPIGQMRWEERSQRRADVICFWVPRSLWELPGLTTNLEWGVWHASGKAVLGAPADAPKMAYLRYWAEVGDAPTADSLEGTVTAAMSLLNSEVS